MSPSAAKPAYVLMTGARKNMGDFLIQTRLQGLLADLRPDRRVIVMERWKMPEGEAWDTVQSAACVLLGGGPFYRPDIFDIFPVLERRHELATPVAFVAGGWKGQDGRYETIAGYRFGAEALAYLMQVAEIIPLSVRDYATAKMLALQGVPATHIRMTGCSAWHDGDHRGEPLRVPPETPTVCFSVPQHERLHPQGIEVMRVLARRFRGSDLYCSFNRGIAADEWTDANHAATLERLAAAARQLGFQVRDTSYGLDRIAFYDECDLHVGYRVHTYLWFAAARRPTYLVHEDGRGPGVSRALGVAGWDAYLPPLKTERGPEMIRHYVNRGLRALTGLRHRPDPSVPAHLEAQLVADAAANYARFGGMSGQLDAHYGAMKAWIEALP